MIKDEYKNQVRLLLSVLPEIAKETCFALHGGTAINLFIRDMPRLSVDIDLTYTLISDRETSFSDINTALARIKGKIERTIPSIRIDHKEEILKLLINSPTAGIKVEVNQASRGLIDKAEPMVLCQRAQEEFNLFCVMPVVSRAQLFGGKICAALDRQHPRDMFDIRHLLLDGGITPEIMRGFLFCLISHSRPVHEVLFPVRQDQRSAYNNQFTGMTGENFSYDDYTQTREELINALHRAITPEIKSYLLNFHRQEANWDIYGFSNFPAVKWKIQNLEQLHRNNPNKWGTLQTELEKGFETIITAE